MTVQTHLRDQINESQLWFAAFGLFELMLLRIPFNVFNGIVKEKKTHFLQSFPPHKKM